MLYKAVFPERSETITDQVILSHLTRIWQGPDWIPLESNCPPSWQGSAVSVCNGIHPKSKNFCEFCFFTYLWQIWDSRKYTLSKIQWFPRFRRSQPKILLKIPPKKLQTCFLDVCVYTVLIAVLDLNVLSNALNSDCTDLAFSCST